MCKLFRPWKIDQTQLLPHSVQDFVDADHLARFIVTLVCEQLDLVEITIRRGSSLGESPLDPRLMVARLLYPDCDGIYSSRSIAKACREGLDPMSIVALDGTNIKANTSKHKAMSYARIEARVSALEA